MDEFWMQLWSGTIGAVLGAIVTIVVLLGANSVQKSLSRNALEKQETQHNDAFDAARTDSQRTFDQADRHATQIREDADRHATQVREDAELHAKQAREDAELHAKQAREDAATESDKRLAEQRDEARIRREIDAVAELLRFLTDTFQRSPEDLDFVPGLVARCDNLTLNSRPDVRAAWLKHSSLERLGFSRHPIALVLTESVAHQRMKNDIQRQLLDKYDKQDQEAVMWVTGGRGLSITAIQKRYSVILPLLLNWPNLPDEEKIDLLKEDIAAARDHAANLVVGAGHLGARVGVQLLTPLGGSLARYRSEFRDDALVVNSLLAGGRRHHSVKSAKERLTAMLGSSGAAASPTAVNRMDRIESTYLRWAEEDISAAMAISST